MNHSSWTIRPANGDDLSFIYATWARSYRYDSSLSRGCRNSVFFPEYNLVIDHILAQDDTEVLVAALESDPLVILGYLVTQAGVAHYAFTKEDFRKMGIAKALWQSTQVPISTYTHRTRTAEPILESRQISLTYNPFLLFKQKGTAHGKKDFS